MTTRRLLAAALILAISVTLGCTSGNKAEDDAPASKSERIIEDMDSAAEATVEPGSPAAAELAGTLITPADVEKVSGMTGLKVVPKDPSVGAGGDTNIATADGQLIVMVSVGDGDFYELTKSGPNFGRDHDGVADESYVGPAADVSAAGTEYLIGVRSDRWGIVIASFLDTAKGGAPYLSVEQLEELARTAVTRL